MRKIVVGEYTLFISFTCGFGTRLPVVEKSKMADATPCISPESKENDLQSKFVAEMLCE